MELFEYIDTLNQPYDIFYTDSVNSKLHWHYYSEILYMRSGSICLTCNNQSAIIEKGDFCYIYPLQLHEITEAPGKSTSSEAVDYAVIKFDIHTINIPKAYLSDLYDIYVHRTSDEDFCRILRSTDGTTERIQGIVENIEQEYKEKRPYYSMAIQSELHSLLVLCARKFQKSKKQESTDRDSDFSFFNILEYIDTHSSEPLEVQDLAAMCCMSYSHFAKRFRENYGRSCKEYITYIRLNKAQDLLLNTSYDLHYIAGETGFYDCSHFVHTYKKWRGITPMQERKKVV